MRQRRYHTNPENTKKILAALWGTASQAEGKHTTLDFLRSVLTETEQIQIGRRLLIAQYLLSGKSWSHIRTELLVSPGTIDLVQTWLKQQVPEYEAALKSKLERVRGSDTSRKRTFNKDLTSFANLRHRYPDHFLLFNLILD